MPEIKRSDLAELARVVALVADAVAQNLGGTMSDPIAAGNLRNLNAQASNLMRVFGS